MLALKGISPLFRLTLLQDKRTELLVKHIDILLSLLCDFVKLSFSAFKLLSRHFKRGVKFLARELQSACLLESLLEDLVRVLQLGL